jgi:hypothetical protein
MRMDAIRFLHAGVKRSKTYEGDTDILLRSTLKAGIVRRIRWEVVYRPRVVPDFSRKPLWKRTRFRNHHGGGFSVVTVTPGITPALPFSANHVFHLLDHTDDTGIGIVQLCNLPRREIVGVPHQRRFRIDFE